MEKLIPSAKSKTTEAFFSVVYAREKPTYINFNKFFYKKLATLFTTKEQIGVPQLLYFELFLDAREERITFFYHKKAREGVMRFRLTKKAPFSCVSWLDQLPVLRPLTKYYIHFQGRNEFYVYYGDKNK